MDPLAARYVRLVCLAGLIAALVLLAFLGGYRWGFLDGYAQFSIEADGKKMRLVPIDPPAQRQ